MPWCEPCDRFYNPNTLLIDGSCPRCSTVLPLAGEDHDHGRHTDREGSASSFAEDADAKIPWHFWLVLVLVALYLGFRVVEGIIWAVQSIL